MGTSRRTRLDDLVDGGQSETGTSNSRGGEAVARAVTQPVAKAAGAGENSDDVSSGNPDSSGNPESFDEQPITQAAAAGEKLDDVTLPRGQSIAIAEHLLDGIYGRQADAAAAAAADDVSDDNPESSDEEAVDPPAAERPSPGLAAPPEVRIGGPAYPQDPTDELGLAVVPPSPFNQRRSLQQPPPRPGSAQPYAGVGMQYYRNAGLI